MEALLKLADRFNVQHVMDTCENYLISNESVDYTEKLILSDRYRLLDLQEATLRKLTNSQQIKKLKKTKGYENLSDNMKVALYEKLLVF